MNQLYPRYILGMYINEEILGQMKAIIHYLTPWIGVNLVTHLHSSGYCFESKN